MPGIDPGIRIHDAPIEQYEQLNLNPHCQHLREKRLQGLRRIKVLQKASGYAAGF